MTRAPRPHFSPLFSQGARLFIQSFFASSVMLSTCVCICIGIISHTCEPFFSFNIFNFMFGCSYIYVNQVFSHLFGYWLGLFSHLFCQVLSDCTAHKEVWKRAGPFQREVRSLSPFEFHHLNVTIWISPFEFHHLNFNIWMSPSDIIIIIIIMTLMTIMMLGHTRGRWGSRRLWWRTEGLTEQTSVQQHITEWNEWTTNWN